MNLERIMRHKGVLLTALKVYEKQLEKVDKTEDDLEVVSNTSTILAKIEELRGELQDQVSLGMEGTPMGDQVAAQVYVAEDGQSLTVDHLDAMLKTVGVDAPLEEIGTWDLAIRQDVYRWILATQQHVLDGKPLADGPEFPVVIDDTWVSDVDDLLERELSDDEIEKFIELGPWGVVALDASKDDWTVRKIERDGDVETITDHPQKYGQVDRARLIAANLNAIELGRTRRDPAPAEASEPVADEAPIVETTMADYHDAKVKSGKKSTKASSADDASPALETEVPKPQLVP